MVFFLIKLQLTRPLPAGRGQKGKGRGNNISKDGFEPPIDSYKETVLPIKLFRLIFIKLKTVHYQAAASGLPRPAACPSPLGKGTVVTTASRTLLNGKINNMPSFKPVSPTPRHSGLPLPTHHVHGLGHCNAQG